MLDGRKGNGAANRKKIMKVERRKRGRRQETLLLLTAVIFSFWPCLCHVEGWVSIALSRNGRVIAREHRDDGTRCHHTSWVRPPPCAQVSFARQTSLFEGSRSDTDDDKHKKLEDDISKRLSVSEDHSSSSSPPHPSGRSYRSPRNLGRSPVDATRNGAAGPANRKSKSAKGLPPQSVRRSDGTHKKLHHHSRGSAELGRPLRSNKRDESVVATQRPRSTTESNAGKRSSPPYFPSLLPPPLSGVNPSDARDDDPLTTGLSSWEEFLGVGSGKPSSSSRHRTAASNNKPLQSQRQARSRQQPQQFERSSSSRKSVESSPSPPDRLPSIQDLFPSDLSSPSAPASSLLSSEASSPPDSIVQPSSCSLDGVLPVSDLFYRSSPLPEDEELELEEDQEDHDDEELPFSAEQSDAITSDNNKLHVRRNLAKQPKLATKQEMAKKATASSAATNKKRNGRKMVRRGMEMLVGGVPINADPPQRSIELSYDGSVGPENWASAITLNTLDFGPLLHASSIPFVTEVERGLFCEHFCQAAMKWDVLPKDLRDIVRSFSRSKMDPTDVMLGEKEGQAVLSTTTHTSCIQSEGNLTGDSLPSDHKVVEEDEDDDADDLCIHVLLRSIPESEDGRETPSRRSTLSRAKGFGKSRKADFAESKMRFESNCELVFELPISKDELESGDSREKGSILKSVLGAAFQAVVFDEFKGFSVNVSKLLLLELGDGTTRLDFELAISNDRPMHRVQVQRRMKRISTAFLQAVDDGVMQVAIATAAKAEDRWPLELRERIAEECLFDEDDIDDVPEDASISIPAITNPDISLSSKKQEDLFASAGNDGVFPDYSASNRLSAPYGGDLGLRLVDAVVQRAKERLPRVIAVGDVHGCIDELQDLLRQCDYRPGDLVVFLGDLVCKGPDSISVVQMAREIGAIGVRGNHDFEVIRWHQAIKSGVDPPVVGSEHFHIASCLTKADMKWMYTLPWYMSSKELGALFVHAGFVSGIRLAKQNPRLMMNMRSILPDGTVTSKFFNNWPWARLWDGPQTVLFGHDADRGLQQYEHAIGLDTGCVYGGRLTACILPEKRLVSVSARREYFKYRRKHYD